MRFASAAVTVFSVGLLVGGSVAPAQHLPPPRIIPAEPPVVIRESAPPLVVYRVSQYEVWKHLAVDRQGRFRPRVIWTPNGAYYSYSGEPYPLITSEPRNFMPYAVD